MRLFISINIPEDIKDSVTNFQKELNKAGGDVKWVEKENLHITLKFIGEASEDKLELIKTVMAEAVRGKTAFEISLKGLALLPSPEKPRVICIGADKGDEEIKSIFSKIEEELVLLDFPSEDREFFSHLTIGRIRSKKNILSLSENIIADEKKEFGSFKLRNIELMHSILLSDGPHYKCLNSVSI
jgi:RNA 2',3'-cyclic 3'-phosphodiesterase